MKRVLTSLKPKDLILFSKAVLKNAELLFKEAELLAKNNCLPRAYFLHQISLEECAKIEIFGHFCVRYFRLGKIEFSRLKSKIISHKSKNITNAYFQRLTDGELKAIKKGDSALFAKEFFKMRERFHKERNYYKNSALYVDIDKDRPLSPQDHFDKKIIKFINEENREYIYLARLKIGVMQYIEKNPKAIETKEMKKRIKSLLDNKSVLSISGAKEQLTRIKNTLYLLGLAEIAEKENRLLKTK